MRNKEQLAYLAGLFDGEGTVFTSFRRGEINRLTSALRIGMTNKQTIDWLGATFGGKIYLENRRPPARPLWSWVLTGSLGGFALASEIVNHSITKQRSLELFIRLEEFVPIYAKGLGRGKHLDLSRLGERKQIVEGIRSLQKKGNHA